MPIHAINLDVHKRISRIPQQVIVRQGEAATETITAQLMDDGEAYTPTLTSARLDMLHSDGTWARVSATLNGTSVTCTLPQAALMSHGLCKLAHFVFYSDTALESTEGFELRILPNVTITADDAQNYDDELNKLYDRWVEFEQMAEEAERQRQEAEDKRETNFRAAIVGAENVNAEMDGYDLLVTNRDGVTTRTNVRGEKGEKGNKGDKGDPGDQDAIDALAALIARLHDIYIVIGETLYVPSSRVDSLDGETLGLNQASYANETLTLT